MKLLLCIGLTLLALSVQAAKPESYTFEFPELIEVADCGDFKVMDDAWITMQIRDFYDNDGNFVRSRYKFTGFDDLYSDIDPNGVHLTGTVHLNAWFAFDSNGDPLWIQQGIAVAIIVPGYGPLFMDAGKLVWNDATGELVFSAGRHHDWNFGEIDALCDYFELP